MRPSELNQLIITLLTSARNADDPSHCLGLTRRQICKHIEEVLPPGQDDSFIKVLWDRIAEQLENLESEFEVVSHGGSCKKYRMSHPFLIIEQEAPLRARFVGDRSYFNMVVEILDAPSDSENWVIETIKSVDESRHLLEANGIALQSEQMLFQFLPDPALPTEIDLSMAERLSKDDIETTIEVYIPQRIDFFTNRWVNFRDALPSAMSQLCRTNAKSFSNKKYKQIYLWKTEDYFYEISKEKAILAAYKIDIDRNKSRLLSMDKFPAEFKYQLPISYRPLFDRYTEECVTNEKSSENDLRMTQRYLEAKYKHKNSLVELLGRLGINKPLA